MEIATIGGYQEVGKNMTAVKIGDDVIIFDAGVYLPPLIEMQDEERGQTPSEGKLRSAGVLPDDSVLKKLGWQDKVRAIIIGHAHLDHVGGVPYIAKNYPKAEIIATPFTMAVLESIMSDDKMKLPNKRRIVNPDTTIEISGKQKLKIDLVHTTHSTLQCVFLALHSKEGIVLYALDFKFDNYPGMGNPPNYKKLRALGKKGVKVLIVDALYSGTNRKTPSERVANHLLEDAFTSVRNRNSALFVTTFSSHISRLRSIVNLGKRTRRQIVFLGRSLNKYVNCAIEIKQCPFEKNVILVKYRGQINSFLKKIEKDRGKYLVVCTGHQAEPGSILDRIANGKTPFVFRPGDNLIFSSSVIPTEVNIEARNKMDQKLRKKQVRIQTDVHVSGHGGAEDLRELIEMVKPEHIIPAHGTIEQETPMVHLVSDMGYKFGKTVHLSSNGKVFKF